MYGRLPVFTLGESVCYMHLDQSDVINCFLKFICNLPALHTAIIHLCLKAKPIDK